MAKHPRHLLRFQDLGGDPAEVELGLTVTVESDADLGDVFKCVVTVTGGPLTAAYLERRVGNTWVRIRFDTTTGIGWSVPAGDLSCVIHEDGLYKSAAQTVSGLFRVSAVDGYKAAPILKGANIIDYVRCGHSIISPGGLGISTSYISGTEYQINVKTVPAGINVSTKHQFPYGIYEGTGRIKVWKTTPSWGPYVYDIAGRPVRYPTTDPDEIINVALSVVEPATGQPYFEGSGIGTWGGDVDEEFYALLEASFKPMPPWEDSFPKSELVSWAAQVKRTIGTTLSANVNDTVTTFPVASSANMYVGDIYGVNTERIRILEILSDTSIEVERAVDNTTVASHTNGDDLSPVQGGGKYAVILKYEVAAVLGDENGNFIGDENGDIIGG